MTEPTPKLDKLPDDILYHIATYSNKRAIWTMMATCHSLREAGERAIRPHLKKQVIRPRHLNSFMVDRYNAQPESPAIYPSSRREAKLRSANKRFADHLIAYPPSATFLRKLTVEVRFTDDEAADWLTLEQLLPQLEHLTLHILENPTHGDPEESDGDDGYNFWEESRNVWDLIHWMWSRIIGSEDLLNLTHLSIHTTSRAFEHLGLIAQQTPNLIHLALGSHWAVSDIYSDGHGPDGVDRLTKLQQITLIGGDEMVIGALEALLMPSPHLQYITLHLLKLDPHPYPIACPWAHAAYLKALPPVPERTKIKGIALYGDFAFDFWFYEMYPATALYNVNFEALTSLILERYSPGAGDWMADYYPLLNDDPKNLPDLPSLKRITFVDRHKDEHGDFTLGSYNPSDHSDFYEDWELKNLFEHFESLQYVQWVAGYPKVPFCNDDPNLRKSRNVKCIVHRPSRTARGKFRVSKPIRP